MWHVIEHVADPLALTRRLASALPKGGCLFVQAPCLKEPWLYREHLLLFTEPAVHALARNAGFEVAALNYDHTLAFVTFVLRRTGEAIPSEWVPVTSFPVETRAVAEVELPRVRRELEETRARATEASALAGERMAAIERQSTMIEQRTKWAESLVEEKSRRDAELAATAERLARTLERAEHAERTLADRDRHIEELRAAIAHHERRFVAWRVTRALEKLVPGKKP